MKKKDTFNDNLKKHAEGFEIKPPADFFDKIKAQVNTSENSENNQFENMLKNHASGFSINPSVDMFDKIKLASIANNNKDEAEFKGIIKKHASNFKVSPSQNLYNKIIARKEYLTIRKYAFYGTLALLLLSFSSFFYWLYNSTDALKKDTHITYKEEVQNQTELDNKKLNEYKLNKIHTNKQETKKSTALIKNANTPKSLRLPVSSNSKQIKPNKTEASKEAEPYNAINTAKHTSVAIATNTIPSNTNDTVSNKNNDINNNTSQNEIASNTITTTQNNDIKNNTSNNETAVNTNTTIESESTLTPKLPMDTAQIVQQQNVALIDKKEEIIVAENVIHTIPLPKTISTKNEEDFKWAIGIYGAPQLLKSEYRSNRANENWANDYLKNKEDFDRARFNYQGGICIERKFNNIYSIVTGIGTSVIRFRELVTDTKMLTSTGSDEDIKVSDRALISKASYDISLVYLDIPVQLQVRKSWKKFSVAAQVGIVYSLLTDATAAVYENDTNVSTLVHGPKNKNLQRNMFYINAGITAEYFMFKHISVFAGPTYRSALNSLYNDSYAISQKPTLYGLLGGIKFSF